MQFVVPIDLGIKVERRAVFQRPSEEGFSLIQRNHRHLAFVNLCTLGYRKRVDLVAVMIVERHGVGRGYPLGIDGDVLGGHGLAVKLIFRLSRRVGIPGVKHVVFFSSRRYGRFVGIARTADISFIFIGSFFQFCTIANVNDIITIAVIVEFCAIVTVTVLSTLILITGESSNRITIFFCNSST